MNIELTNLTLKTLSSFGVQDYVVCAGARNAPLVKVLSRAIGIKCFYFFDERAASFFALGRARREGRSVAVVTTSGTAVAELLPCAVEAHYSGVPLVFITADRPKSFRGSGAPQAIEQVGIFSHYAKLNFDLSDIADVTELAVSRNGLTHINICFDELLIDTEISVLDLTSASIRPLHTNEVRGSNEVADTEVCTKLKKMKKPLIILSAISLSYRSAVFEQLLAMGAPIYAEAQSGLREEQKLAALSIQCGSDIFSKINFSEHFDSVIRIGSVPTLRLWRDLEDKLSQVPVLSVSEISFSGLARENMSSISYEQWFRASKDIKFLHGQEFLNQAEYLTLEKEKLISRHPCSEPSYFSWLSKQIPNNSQVFVGNSLPIREWDLAATTSDKKFTVVGNRGANGIDGLISTFLGMAQEGVENWLVLGDLSAMYDLNALGFSKYSVHEGLRVVVINNGGGQIFQNMFHDPNFINAHNTEFSKWADMFGWAYLKISKPEEFKLQQHPTVIEICPEASASEKFWVSYKDIFK